jgi:hypothetical protein
MAEDEIVKHTKAIYKAWKNPHTGWAHKLKEIILEILIITFAISLSVWVHNWSDSLKEKKEERAFLQGLKVDLQGDIKSADSTKRYFKKCATGFRYFMGVSRGAPISIDSESHYNTILVETPESDFHVNRYEGLKGSGKFGIVQNQDLLNNIIYFHESILPEEQRRTNEFSRFLPRLTDYFVDHVSINSQGTSISDEQNLFRSQHMFLLLEIAREFAEQSCLPYQDTCINRSKALIAEIDKELGKN